MLDLLHLIVRECLTCQVETLCSCSLTCGNHRLAPAASLLLEQIIVRTTWQACLHLTDMLTPCREMDLWPCSEQQSQHVQRVLGLAPLLPEDPPEAKPHPRKGPAGKATQQPQSQAPAANALHAGPGASSTATSRQPPRPAHAAGAAPLAQHYPPRGQPGMPVAAMPVAQARPPVAFRMELPPVLNALLAGLGPLQVRLPMLSLESKRCCIMYGQRRSLPQPAGQLCPRSACTVLRVQQGMGVAANYKA